ncbi:hypothetical protein [Providencia rettgeri]|uniref:hypothetical protein n=1 Tax=Providencia rettgeri TaxID=587 RepID=UPI001B3987E4|nr:hypothetical protein [Providencia rettgeri]MBQ0371825.1 hypothetical protein [Providencia rettgeri]
MEIKIEMSEPKEFNKTKTACSDEFSVIKRLRALSAAKHDIKQDIISVMNKAIVTYGLSPLDVDFIICELSSDVREVYAENALGTRGKGIHCMSDIPLDDNIPF